MGLSEARTCSSRSCTPGVSYLLASPSHSVFFFRKMGWKAFGGCHSCQDELASPCKLLSSQPYLLTIIELNAVPKFLTFAFNARIGMAGYFSSFHAGTMRHRLIPDQYHNNCPILPGLMKNLLWAISSTQPLFHPVRSL